MSIDSELASHGILETKPAPLKGLGFVQFTDAVPITFEESVAAGKCPEIKTPHPGWYVWPASEASVGRIIAESERTGARTILWRARNNRYWRFSLQ